MYIGYYEENLSELISHLRTNVLKKDDLKIILGVDEQHPFVKERPLVLEVQKKIALKDVNIIYTTMYGLPKSDATHLTPAGLIEHGHRIFRAYKVVENLTKLSLWKPELADASVYFWNDEEKYPRIDLE